MEPNSPPPGPRPFPKPLPIDRVRALPLEERKSLSRLEEILVDPDSPAPDPGPLAEAIRACAATVRAARARGATVLLFYGAHLVKNGGGAVLRRLVEGGWVTHLATNGAGTIHDWEFSFLGRSTESVRANVATGTFGAWDETGQSIHLALLAGALRGEGWGVSLGRFIAEDGTVLPSAEDLEEGIRREPAHPLTAARADLLSALRRRPRLFAAGRFEVRHPWKGASVLAGAFAAGVPVTVHPGIGYDIVAVHPLFSGSVLGRAGDLDFRLIGRAVEGLDGGAVLSIGSAIMAPQVFEKSLSCVNNLRIQAGRPIVKGHEFYVVDLQDGGRWDWSRGEPPRDNPAYYLRFCKSFARMGGTLHYVQGDNVTFLHNLLAELRQP